MCTGWSNWRGKRTSSFPAAGFFLKAADVKADPAPREVAKAASRVAAYGGVRRAMREEQRRIASHNSAVLEGRDIGTVVFPEAQVKVFLDASPEERARRRAAELGLDGAVPREQVAREMAERDRRDLTRAEAPLTQAPDADYLDTTKLSCEEVEEAILKLVRKRTSN